MRGSGGWQTELGLGLIKEADAIFTNPPFSIITPFIKAISGKEFAIIAPVTATTYTFTYPLLYSGRVVAYKQDEKIIDKSFFRPTGEVVRVYYTWLSTFKLKPIPFPPGVQWSADIAGDYPLLDAPLDFARNVKGKYFVPRGYNGWLAVPINTIIHDMSEWVLYHKSPNRLTINGKPLFRRAFIKERRFNDAPSSVDSLCPSHRTMRLF